MAKIVILKTGSTHPVIQQTFGDFEQWFRDRLENGRHAVVVDVTQEEPRGRPDQWAGIIVTGSPAMVTAREPWSEQTAAWLRTAVEQEVPILGVCYGHQLLAHALGGEVGFRTQGRESGTFEIVCTDEVRKDPIWANAPSSFSVHLTHAQSVLKLPTEAVLLAHSQDEPHQAFRVGPNAWGVQFHPEFTDKVMTAYLESQAASLAEEGQDVQQLFRNVRPAPEAVNLIRRFERYALDRTEEPAD